LSVAKLVNVSICYKNTFVCYQNAPRRCPSLMS
jgi:hypothetical protein